MTRGCVPPGAVQSKAISNEVSAVGSDSHRVTRVGSQQGGREGNKSNRHQEDDVDPEQCPIGPPDVVKLVMVADPVEAECDEAQGIGQNVWRELEHFI